MKLKIKKFLVYMFFIFGSQFNLRNLNCLFCVLSVRTTKQIELMVTKCNN